MIISASYKTDIPTFYGDWLMNRIRAGYCKTVNPFNSRQRSHVDLRRESVDGLVLWTKNIGPFMKHLPELRDRGYPFIIQHTINGYPKALERSVVDADSSVAHVRELADAYGPDAVVWRYDTVVFTSETPRSFHVKNFERLAGALAPSTNEVVVSFAQLYKKTLRNMNESAAEHGFTWRDPAADEKRVLLTRFVDIGGRHGLRVTVCTQPELEVPGSESAKCIDGDRMARVAGARLKVPEKGNRPGCKCAASKDIGDYDTCPHGCVYCYAVRNRGLALRRYREHDPQGEYLFPMPDDDSGKGPNRQLTLID